LKRLHQWGHPLSASQPIGSVTSHATTTAQSIRDLGPTTKLKKANAPEQFEAFVMQSFIEEMLPKSADGVFGSGLAGDYWRSMLAEQVAGQVAKRGGIGIAKMISGGDHAGIKDSLSSVPPPPVAAPVTAAAEGGSVADVLASGPPVSLSDILGD
jgi:hypothetical protein